MSWHNFQPGQEYAQTEVVSVLSQRIRSGNVENPDQKEEYLDLIRAASATRLVFDPKGTGWGSSPLNPNNWRTPEGVPVRIRRS